MRAVTPTQLLKSTRWVRVGVRSILHRGHHLCTRACTSSPTGMFSTRERPPSPVPLILLPMLGQMSPQQNPAALVRCPGDFVSTDSPPRIGIGPAEWSRGLGVGANVFPQFPR